MGLKLWRFGLEVQIWTSLAMGSVCIHSRRPDTPGRMYKNEKRRKEGTKLNPEKHQGILKNRIKKQMIEILKIQLKTEN